MRRSPRSLLDSSCLALKQLGAMPPLQMGSWAAGGNPQLTVNSARLLYGRSLSIPSSDTLLIIMPAGFLCPASASFH